MKFLQLVTRRGPQPLNIARRGRYYSMPAAGLMHHHIVALDTCPAEQHVFDFAHTIEYHASTRPDQLPSRLRNATIAITGGTRITREGILAAPRLQLVAINATGTDTVDRHTLADRGIPLCNVPGQNTTSVAEHVLALYYGLRSKLLDKHNATMAGNAWAVTRKGPQWRLQLGCRVPRLNSEETMVIFGYGAIGRKTEALGKALGMRVLIAERRGASQTRAGRVPFSKALSLGTLFVVATPLDESTRDMIGADELAVAGPKSLFINVGRGGIINETDLVHALRQGLIGGAATDVFASEPPTKTSSPLLDSSIPNLLLSPHTAWYSKRTMEDTCRVQRANIEGFVAGKMINVVAPPWRVEDTEDVAPARQGAAD